MVQQRLDYVGAQIRALEPILELNSETARSAPDLDDRTLRDETVRNEQVLLHRSNRKELLLRTPNGQLQALISLRVVAEQGPRVGLVRGYEIEAGTYGIASRVVVRHWLNDRGRHQGRLSIPVRRPGGTL